MRLTFNAQWPFILAGIVLLAAFSWQSLRAGQSFAGGGGHISIAGAVPGTLRVLRAAAVACMVFCLLEPVLFIMETSMQSARLAVLVDASVSMKQSDKPGESRWSTAVKWLSDNARPIEKLSDPVYFYFTDKLSEFNPRQAGPAFMPAAVGLQDSNLDMALEQLTEKTACRPERIWVITDGLSQAENTGVDPSVPVPVDFIGAGESSQSPGININSVRYPDFAFLHLPLKISVLWEAHRLAGSRVRIKLEREDATVVAQKSEVLKSDYQELESTLTARTDGLGSKRWRLVISAKGPGACQAVSKEMRFQVIREKWRIMYLCGKPSPEYANLREFLKADPNLELVSFVILRNPEDVSPVPDMELALIPFPAQEIFVKDIHHFDILILQNFSFRRFNLPPAYLSSVRDFVNKGGGLMVIGGDSAFASGYYRETPLETALPVEMLNSDVDYQPDFLRVVATDHPVARLAGTLEESRRLWKDVPPLKGFNRFAGLKKGALAVLNSGESGAAGAGRPVLAAWEYGKGKVMVMASPSTWRWKMSAGYSWKMSSFYFSFWTRVLQYLSGSLDLKRVQLAAPPQEPVAGEIPTVVLRVLDETFNPLNDSSADIRAYWQRTNSDEELPLEFRMTQAGIFKASLRPPHYGSQKIRAVVKSQGRAIGEDEVKFRMNRPSEKTRPVDRAGLESLAKKFGGRYSSIYGVNAGKWLKDLPEQEKGERIRSRKNLRDFTFWLALVSVLLLLEWFLRRLWGFS